MLGFTYHMGIQVARTEEVKEFREGFWEAAAKFRDMKFVIGDVVENENIVRFFSLNPR